MEFTSEFIEENQLSETQVSAITTLAANHVAELQKGWDSKANENAEKIIEGAGKKVVELSGIAREQGEKWANYLERANGLYFEGTKNNLARKEQELEEKLKNNSGDEGLKTELSETKEALKALKQKEAQFDEWQKSDYKGKYEQTAEKLTLMQKRIAFNSVTPSKPDNVNEYEWKAKWKEWQNEILEKNNIVFDDNDNAWAVDKENEFKKSKLSDLAKANSNLQELMKGREQKGLGSQQGAISIEGVPFKVPKEATPQERQKAIKDYLASQNILPTSQEYSKKFSELNSKILGLGKKQAS